MMNLSDHGPAVTPASLDTLIPYARNARTHSDQQVAQLAASLVEFGWTNPVIVDGDANIIAGHGRVLAARKVLAAKGKIPNWPDTQQVPTIMLKHLTAAQKRAYILADNQLAANAGWDADLLSVELDDLRDDGFNLELLGFERQALNDLIGTPNTGFDGDEAGYSRKIKAPIYEPSGEQPRLADLIDDSKTRALIARIDASDEPPDVKHFLRKAAERHTVIDFRKVADYYAHAPASVQALMEEQVLVIIDFDKAIALGYVRLSEGIAEQYAKDRSNATEGENDDA